MALRVLLADESPTIKKVFQLALQDFAVEVTSVSLGTDVLQIAKQFKPDIVFCDILLQKMNGYEVCAEIKNDSALGKIPVILIWSAFMELDRDKFQACRAEGDLQKPFEVHELRQIVTQLVDKTRQQKIGQYLNFPKVPEMTEETSTQQTRTKPSTNSSSSSPNARQEPIILGGAGTSAPQTSPSQGAWSMESFDPIPNVGFETNEPQDDFEEIQLPPSKDADLINLDDEDDDHDTQWSTKSFGRFKIKPPEENHDVLAVSIPNENQEAQSNLNRNSQTSDDDILELEIDQDEPTQYQSKSFANRSIPQAAVSEKMPPAAQSPSLSTQSPHVTIPPEVIEKIVREQAKMIIESIAWKVVPDLAAQIIERELQRLIAEKNP